MSELKGIVKKNILIVGITGFLGINLVKAINEKYNDIYNIVGISRSKDKILKLNNQYKHLKIYSLDIVKDNTNLENIFRDIKIDYVINTAALKYVDKCENNPLNCVEVNLISVIELIKLSVKYNVKNLISISSDKANKPINNYGMSKYLMQQIIKQHNFSYYEGVNFFWSDGSVLDIWFKLIQEGKDICVTNFNQERYFIEVNNICFDILNNIDKKNSVIKSTNIFRVKLIDLFNAFTEYFKYDKEKCIVIGDQINEKVISTNSKEYNNISKNEIIKKIKNYIDDNKLVINI